MHRAVILLPVVALLASAECGEPAPTPTLTALKEDIFVPRCGNAACHGGSNPARGLDLTQDVHAALVGVASEEDEGVLRVAAGDPDASLLFQVLSADVGSVRQMPPGFQLADEDIAGIRAWIEDGAKDD
jgi:hypothetical protein